MVVGVYSYKLSFNFVNGYIMEWISSEYTCTRVHGCIFLSNRFVHCLPLYSRTLLCNVNVYPVVMYVCKRAHLCFVSSVLCL